MGLARKTAGNHAAIEAAQAVPPRAGTLSTLEQLRAGRQVLATEAEALASLARTLDGRFCDAVEAMVACRGFVVVSGMGKAGHVGQKISATLASTGTRSFFLHPAEAVHGDLGRLGSEDLVLALSQSGETEEMVRLLPTLAARKIALVCITSHDQNTLARAADVVLELGNLQEACTLGLAPTTSSTAMLAVGDALAVVASQVRGFSRMDFAQFHPAGKLGRKLSRVEDQMRPLTECRVAHQNIPVREVFATIGQPGRRSGAIMLINDQHQLSGLFTDSDLARLFEGRQYNAFDQPIASVMTRAPAVVPLGTMLEEAVQTMAQRKLSELPVIDQHQAPVGMLDITDVMQEYTAAATTFAIDTN